MNIPPLPIDHRGVCRGNQTCPKCGRRMCEGCTIHDGAYENPHAKGHKGECLICGEMFTEDEIILWSSEKVLKEELKEKEGPIYRLIRL
jgi:hypothetical protein